MFYQKKIAIYKNLFNSNQLGATKPEIGFLNYFNRWIVVFICIWYTWPFINYRLGILPLLILILLWFLTTDLRWVVKGLTIDLVMCVIWFISFLPYILTNNFHFGNLNPKYVLISFLLFFCGMFMNHYYMYYNKNIKTLGTISFFTILFYFIASFQSYFGLKEYPLAARTLATGNYDPLMQTYMSLGIGGFGFVYSAVFVNIVLLYFVLNKDNRIIMINKIIALVAFTMITMMLLVASYATSLLFLFVGCVFVFFIRGKRSFIFSFIFAFFLFLLVPSEMIGYLLIDVAKLFKDNGVINSKFTDLAQGFISDSFGSQTSGRGQLYLTSLQTFIHNPLFGIYGPFGDNFNAEVGGHSGWLDFLAYYGLFGSLPLFAAIFFNFKKQLKIFFNHPYRHFILTAQILFIIFGFINPVLYIYQLGFALFVVLPSIPYLPVMFSNQPYEKGISK